MEFDVFFAWIARLLMLSNITESSKPHTLCYFKHTHAREWMFPKKAEFNKKCSNHTECNRNAFRLPSMYLYSDAFTLSSSLSFSSICSSSFTHNLFSIPFMPVHPILHNKFRYLFWLIVLEIHRLQKIEYQYQRFEIVLSKLGFENKVFGIFQ